MVTPANMANIYTGLKDDAKPTEGIYNGSWFLEMDTARVFVFDEENVKWWPLDGQEDEGE